MTESLSKKDTSSVVPRGDLTDTQQPFLRDTRFQKQVAKVSSPNDHAGTTTKDSSCNTVIENETSNLLCPGVSTRSSTRPNKRQRCLSPSVQAAGSQDAKAVVSAGNTTGGAMKGQRKKKKKEKRQWESWGPEDKDTFFEALHVYGKDFDKVQNFIATRQKRRGEVPSLIKNKDQVRHFYYRTLNKISKYIPAEKLGENDTQKKTLYELLSLICYGELRKKMQGLNEKLGKKLNELINDGATSIRYNQRNIRIKAPACRALKKLLDDGETQPPPIPSKLVIEIVPLDNTAWTTVQRLAKNPRLRTTVSSKKQLNSLLYYLKSKWPLVCASEEALDICFVVPSEFDSSNIHEYSDTVPTKPPGNPPTMSQCNSSPKDAKNVEEASLCSDKASVKEKNCNVPLDLVDTSEVMDCGKENRPSSLTHSNVDVELVLSSQKETQDDSKDVQDCEMVVENSHDKNTPKEEELKYWNLQNCGHVTVGDVYCKVGRPSKVKLQYCWKAQNNSKRNWNQDALQKLLKVAATEFKEIKENKQSENVKSSASKQTTSAKVSSNSAQSKKTKIAPKRNERLPFLLPSVVPPSVQDSNRVTPLSPPIRPISRARKQQRKSAPVIVPQRTLLPRPANTVPTVAATAVPPGAVAVSFIPQPGQAVGTILAAGLPTTSVATVTSQLSTTKHSTANSPGLSTSSQTLETPVMSPANSQSSSPAPADSSESMSTSHHLHKSINLSEQPSENASPVIQEIQTTSTVSEPSLFSGESVHARSQGNNVLESFDLDHFVTTSVRNGGTEGTTTDSIIGLALGSVLNHNSTMPSAAISEDSASEFLTNFLSTSSKDADSCRVSEGLYISSGGNATSLESTVHIEELNSGIAGGTPVTLASGTMNDANISLFSPISSSETFVSGEVKCSTITTAPLMGPSEILCSTTNGEKSSENILITGSITSSMSPEVSPLRIHFPSSEPQWLNGEAADISMSSILDKLVTSPEKRTENFGLSSLPVEIRDSASQDALLSSRLMDMDTAFHAMMEENSVDYIKKFQDLTNRMTGPALNNLPHSSSEMSDLSKDTTSAMSDSAVSFSNFFNKHNR